MKFLCNGIPLNFPIINELYILQLSQKYYKFVLVHWEYLSSTVTLPGGSTSLLYFPIDQFFELYTFPLVLANPNFQLRLVIKQQLHQDKKVTSILTINFAKSEPKPFHLLDHSSQRPVCSAHSRTDTKGEIWDFLRQGYLQNPWNIFSFKLIMTFPGSSQLYQQSIPIIIHTEYTPYNKTFVFRGVSYCAYSKQK